MSVKLSRRACLGAAGAGWLGRAFAAEKATLVAVEHARVHPVAGPPIDDGTVLFRATPGAFDSDILEVGRSSQVAVPAAAERIDARGMHVTPGLFDAEAQTGLVEVQLESSTDDTSLDERYNVVRAAFSVLDGWNPRSLVIPVTRMEGVTTTALAPHGGFVSGQGAVVSLGAPAAPLVPSTAVYVDLSETVRGALFRARGGTFLRLRELLDDVRQFARRRGDFERNQMRTLIASRLDLEALVPVVEGKKPLVVEAHRASDITAVLRLASDEKLRVVLSGATEAWMVAAEIAAARVPVILTPSANLPRSFESLGARLDSAARLVRAGVTVAISPRERDMHLSRNLRLEAGIAVAHGLPWDAALAAITRVPAEIFGGGTGTLTKGAPATLVLWSGDPFEPLSNVERLYVQGSAIALRSRQTELRDRYRPR